jgi:hypothetical protein
MSDTSIQELVLSPGQWVVAGLLAGTLIVVHLLAVRIAQLSSRTQLRLASLGGGVAAAYVFVQVMPELAEGGRSFTDIEIADYAPTPLVESSLFLVALIGMIAMYSLDVFADSGRGSSRSLYRAHLSTFGAISALYAYTMPSLVTTGVVYAVLFTVAICAHTLLSDRTLARAHPQHFRHEDRWVGIVGVAIGITLAALLPPASELALAIPTALLGGGLLMTTFRDELPSASKARLPWLLMGAASTAGLLILANVLRSTGTT